MSAEVLNVHVLRDAPYKATLALQRSLFERLVDCERQGLPPVREHLLLVEHLPVYTLGRHGHHSNVTNMPWIASKGADVVEIDRGGDITFHGPGQLVAYPIINLRHHGLGVKDYVNMLEESVIRTVAEYGIAAGRCEGATGVWVGNRKICAIGIRCSRFVTMHGLALNVTTDLEWFRAINPCGFTDRGVTSIALETQREVSWDDAARRLQSHLQKLLG